MTRLQKFQPRKTTKLSVSWLTMKMSIKLSQYNRQTVDVTFKESCDTSIKCK